jgi:hypothetical protein
MRMTIILIALLVLAGAAAALNTLEWVAMYQGDGTQYYNNFGCSITTGDFNHDGYQEFLIGCFGWNNYTGKNYFFQGGDSIPTTWTWTIQGVRENQCYDYTDANIGDVNGDGIDDFSLSAAIYGAQNDTAKVDVYFGASPLDTIPDWTFRPIRHAPYDDYAFMVDSCGDVNGDEFNDLIILSHTILFDTTWIQIFFGGPNLDTIPDWAIFTTELNYNVAGIGDVNRDGFNDVMVYVYDGPVWIYYGGNPMDTIPDVIFNNGRLGFDAAAGVGDINGDGYADVAMCWEFPDSSHLRDVVYFGGQNMNTEPDLWLQQEEGATSASWAITHGDFNADGYNDIVTTSGFAFGLDRVRVWLGSPNMNPVPDAFVQGNAWYEFGKVISAGDINNDSRSELFAATFNSWNTGTVYLYQPTGTWIDYGAQGVNPEILQRQPGWFALDQNYPNPFNATTSIHFELGKKSLVSLSIWDLQGRMINELINDKSMLPGGYNVSWTGTDEQNKQVTSGIYLLKLSVDQFQEVKKMALLR